MAAKKSFSEQVGAGFAAHGTALIFLFEKGLWKFLFFPLLLLLLMLIGGNALAQRLTDILGTYLFEWLGIGQDNSGWMHYFTGIFQWILGLGIRILMYFVFSYVAKFLLLVLLSPVMAYLSERTEELLSGTKQAVDWGLFLKNCLRGIVIATRNLVIQLLVSCLCFICCFIPVVGWFAPIFLLLSGYYFIGFSMMDYVYERRGFGIRQSALETRKNKWLAITLGFVFSVLFVIPYIGIIFAPILAPIAAAIAVVPDLNSNTRHE